MIDDTNRNIEKPPVKTVSFADLESMGFEITVEELPKLKPSGEWDVAVRVLGVTKFGKPYPKSYMKELLYVLGIETLAEGAKYWVVKKRSHRCLSQKDPVYTYRFMGMERLDSEYLQSGRASLESYMYASKMKDMSKVVDNMRNGGGDS